MPVLDAPDDARLVDLGVRIQRDAVLFRRIERLQTIHVVGQCDLAGIAKQIVPRRPRRGTFRQQGRIGMQTSVIR